MNPETLPSGATAPIALRHNAVARILGSQAFAGSARLTSFLRFVCDEALAGRGASLNEHLIGQRVFGRPESFNPSEDSIVRSGARLLRQRLERYYQNEGTDDRLRIVIPRGSYVPVFIDTADDGPAPPTASRERAAAPSASVGASTVGAAPLPHPRPVQAPTVVSPSQRGARETAYAESLPAAGPLDRGASLVSPAPLHRPMRSRRHVLRAAAACAGVGAASAVAWMSPHWAASPTSDPAAALWRQLIDPDRDLLLVPADSGLVMWQTEHHRVLPLDDYLSTRAGGGGDPSSWSQGNARRYTGVVSVRLAVELTRRAGPQASRVRVRFARDLHLGELKEANAVLVGTANANPWAQLFKDQCSFHIDLDASERFVVHNRAPRSGEAPSYTYDARDPLAPGYAHIALKRNVGGRGHVLLIGGTGSQGTEAGIDFLLDPVALTEALKQANPAGQAWSEMEILLRSRFQNGGSAGHEVLAARFEAQA